MTDEIYGTIESISTKDGISEYKGKPYRLWQFVIDGHKYSTFNIEIGSKFKVGDYVKMTGQQEGKYWSMKTMELADKSLKPVEKQEYINDNPNTTDLLRKIYAEIVKINARAELMTEKDGEQDYTEKKTI